MKYEDFTISMEPPSLAALAELIRDDEHDRTPVVKAELLNLACEIEARMQHLAQQRPHPEVERSNPEEDWLS